jgi:hypothetical protein
MGILWRSSILSSLQGYARRMEKAEGVNGRGCVIYHYSRISNWNSLIESELDSDMKMDGRG